MSNVGSTKGSPLVSLKAPPAEAPKDASMDRQKAMLAGWFEKLSHAKEDGRKVAYTFVPGNLVELLAAFDVAPVYPEINALQSGMRQKSAEYIREAERDGHSEDVCTYVKCDLGMMKKGNVGPTGTVIPPPDLLLLSYTGCFTFLKWFELLKEEYGCELQMLHVPYSESTTPTPEAIKYVVRQLEETIIPALERLTGKKFDPDRLSAELEKSARAEDLLVKVLELGKQRPAPIDAYFGGVYYVGPIFTAFRGSADCVAYYQELLDEANARLALGEGPPTPSGVLTDQKYRLVFEGPPNWTSFREFWKIFSDEGAIAVASTYTKVGGLYDRGFRHDPKKPLESLAAYCLGCYTNLPIPDRVDMIERYVREYEADGFVMHSVKSCNSFSAGQLVMMREIEKRTGIAGAFIESDLVDPRYYSHANLKNRIESYLQMISEKRRGAAIAAGGR